MERNFVFMFENGNFIGVNNVKEYTSSNGTVQARSVIFYIIIIEETKTMALTIKGKNKNLFSL
jgi:hypothetical protein